MWGLTLKSFNTLNCIHKNKNILVMIHDTNNDITLMLQLKCKDLVKLCGCIFFFHGWRLNWCVRIVSNLDILWQYTKVCKVSMQYPKFSKLHLALDIIFLTEIITNHFLIDNAAMTINYGNDFTKLSCNYFSHILIFLNTDCRNYQL